MSTLSPAHWGPWAAAGTLFAEACDAQVRYREERMSFLHFLTSVCAIVGGVFTVSGILDAFVYHGAQAVRKKVDLGKQI